MAQRVLLIFIVAAAAKAHDSCLTPNEETGECILFKNCAALASYLDGTRNNTQFLRRSQCGFFGGEPKVCCPKVGEKTKSFNKTDLLPDIDSCGPLTSSKIVGGERTSLDEFPWMAILEYQTKDGNRSFECGGVLISDRYVLTAAHCILPSLINVRLGEYNTDTDPDCVQLPLGTDCAPPVVNFRIEKKIRYEAYNDKDDNHYHDIGLLRLDRKVKFSDFIKPICLPLTNDEKEKHYVGEKLTVAGWGLTEHNVKSSYKLKASLPVHDLEQCQYKYKKFNSRLGLDESQICAGGVNKRDACRGDSGGPLMDTKTNKKKDTRIYAVGIVSYGPNPCGQEALPGVYTKVAHYIDWIVDSLRP